MDEKTKKFQKAFLIFTIAQIFIILGLFDYATQIKALSDWLFIFTICELVGCVLMIIAATMLVSINKNYFYLFVTAIIDLFIIMLSVIASESTEDFTVAWSKGLSISGDILLALVYIYFFLGTRDYFIEADLGNNVKRSRSGFLIIMISTIVVNLIAFVRTFRVVKTNYIAEAILRYGSFFLQLGVYIFVLVVLILMIVHMQKKRKEADLHEKEQ